MPDETRRLLLLDTASLYFRAFFGIPDSVKAPDGTSVNAVRGLLDFISRLVTTYQPTHLVSLDVADFDRDGRPTFVTGSFHAYGPFTNLSRINLWHRATAK